MQEAAVQRMALEAVAAARTTEAPLEERIASLEELLADRAGSIATVRPRTLVAVLAVFALHAPIGIAVEEPRAQALAY